MNYEVIMSNKKQKWILYINLLPEESTCTSRIRKVDDQPTIISDCPTFNQKEELWIQEVLSNTHDNTSLNEHCTYCFKPPTTPTPILTVVCTSN